MLVRRQNVQGTVNPHSLRIDFCVFFKYINFFQFLIIIYIELFKEYDFDPMALKEQNNNDPVVVNYNDSTLPLTAKTLQNDQSNLQEQDTQRLLDTSKDPYFNSKRDSKNKVEINNRDLININDQSLIQNQSKHELLHQDRNLQELQCESENRRNIDIPQVNDKNFLQQNWVQN